MKVIQNNRNISDCRYDNLTRQAYLSEQFSPLLVTEQNGYGKILGLFFNVFDWLRKGEGERGLY